MPSKSPRAAVEASLNRLRRVASCITDRPVIGTGYRPSPQPYYFGFAPTRGPISLRTRHGRRGVQLWMTQEYVIEQVTADRRGYQVRVTYYAYAVLDSDGREILAYHWHPTSVSPIAYPHLHLSSRIRPIDIGPDADPVALADMHLPTGPITLEDIVRLLITEFAIAPRREHWDDILAEGG